MLENWNAGNTVILYGKNGDQAGPDREHAEVSMLALHLLRAASVLTPVIVGALLPRILSMIPPVLAVVRSR